MGSQFLNQAELDRMQNYGFTDQGAAIVAVHWFQSLDQAIGMVLICNPEGIYKAYIRHVVIVETEASDARHIAHWGAKVPNSIAAGAFPGHFTPENYDRPT